MSGPPYPRPAPGQGYGQNAIGTFTIGESPVGDYAYFDYWLTVISQYANSAAITALIADFQAWIDQTQNFDNLYDNIWNVVTAQGYGLDVWGRIVGVTRTLTIADTVWFGFAEALPTSRGFGVGSFWSGQGLTSNYQLSDNAYRTLIYAKAAANITNGSIQAINAILMALFPHRGNAYVSEGQPQMKYFGFTEALPTSTGFNQGPFYGGGLFTGLRMTYVFTFPLQPFELAIVQSSGVLPKPTGVLALVKTP